MGLLNGSTISLPRSQKYVGLYETIVPLFKDRLPENVEVRKTVLFSRRFFCADTANSC